LRITPSLQAAAQQNAEQKSLLSNSRTNGLLLGRLFWQQSPNRTPFCLAPLLVCLVVQVLYCQELARVTALLNRVNELLKV